MSIDSCGVASDQPDPPSRTRLAKGSASSEVFPSATSAASKGQGDAAPDLEHRRADNGPV